MTLMAFPDPGADNEDDATVVTNESRWRFGLRRILGKSSQMLQKLNTLLLKVVTTIFPWNRRAKRRLYEGAEGHDEL